MGLLDKILGNVRRTVSYFLGSEYELTKADWEQVLSHQNDSIWSCVGGLYTGW